MQTPGTGLRRSRSHTGWGYTGFHLNTSQGQLTAGPAGASNNSGPIATWANYSGPISVDQFKWINYNGPIAALANYSGPITVNQLHGPIAVDPFQWINYNGPITVDQLQ